MTITKLMGRRYFVSKIKKLKIFWASKVITKEIIQIK